MSLPGSRKGVEPRAESEQSGRSNYFIGKDPTKWVRDVPSYSRVRYRDIFPGVDIVYYGNQGQLEYDFVVAPGADPTPIRLAFRGASKAALNKSGDLEFDVDGHRVVQNRPVIYQEIDGQRTPVSGSYVLNSRQPDGTPIEVSLNLGDYDRGRPLIIDPVLVYSTYVSGTDNDEVRGIALDAEGNLYATGQTYSIDFPVVGGLPPGQGGQPNYGSVDAFVLKLNPQGNALIYSTYLSGSGDEFVSALKLNAANEAYIAGSTGSTNFPIVGGLPPGQAGTSSGVRCPFVAKLSAKGDALVYSTYIAADDSIDEVYALALDAAGSAYVTGWTSPPYHFPVVGGLPNNLGGSPAGDATIIIAKLTPSGNALAYSTYLSGSGFEWATTLAVDAAGQVYVGGMTTSFNLPRVGGLPPWQGGLPGPQDNAYFAKLNANGDDLVYSTYFAGSGVEHGDVLTVDAKGSLYIAGRTSSPDLPIVGGLPPEQGGGGLGDDCCVDLYIAKLNPAGNALVYSTYVAGNWVDQAQGLVVDDAGNLYLSGSTNSTNFPQVSGLPFDQGGSAPIDDGSWGQYGPPPCAFVSKLNAAGNSWIFSTYLCGNALASSLARSDNGNVYVGGVVGYAPGITFPVLGGLPPDQGGTPRGAGESFIAALNENAPLLSFARARLDALKTDAAVEVTVIRSGTTEDAVTVDYATMDGTAIAGTDYVATAGTLHWPAGDGEPRTVSINLIANGQSGEVSFRMQLSDAMLAEIGTPEIATIKIRIQDVIFANGFEMPLP